MILDFANLAPRDRYAWMIDIITPRPIAWISTISADGRTNLAPFSFFQGVCAQPPTLLFVGANDRNGKKKDTIVNIEQVPEFVVCVVPHVLAAPMSQTSAALPHGESEFEKFGIAAAASTRVRPPRVADSPVALECRLDRIITVGDGPLAGNLVLGQIVCAHVNEQVLNAEGRIDPAKLDLIARMGGDLYARTTERFAISRPS